ncbi:hypothetical protein Rhe02_60650 [Rhizocola hellebori]|uniref:Uncharacterized protein n=1 Tax=Rhizocola hellebori TaxID=1392758 RepID=A0A8J3QBV3_9ACTN|nr:hypothetical protein [Rhizocola hellebori]GIH07998.1 hypothetical protein Rhe02_60650 [Rhizocola hellebori]
MEIAKRLLLTMALAISTAFLVPANPASAGGQEIRVCFEVGTFGGHRVFDCFTVVVPDLAPKPPWPPTCLSCPAALIIDNELDPKFRFDFIAELGEGLQLLGEAELAGDPGKAKELIAKATDVFLASAARLDGAEARLENVGWADLKNGKFHDDTTNNPALKATGEDLVAGLSLMQLAMGDPHPEPNIEAAMARFGQAYQDIATVYGG